MADLTFAYDNLAIGGGIFTAERMKEVAEAGITHIIDCQAEFDDTPLAKPFGIEVLWCPVFDDFSAPELHHFEDAAQFIEKTILSDPNAKLLVHCAGGVHRGPMFGLLAAMMHGESSHEAMNQIDSTRLIASFPKVYRSAVEKFLARRHKGK